MKIYTPSHGFKVHHSIHPGNPLLSIKHPGCHRCVLEWCGKLYVKHEAFSGYQPCHWLLHYLCYIIMDNTRPTVVQKHLNTDKCIKPRKKLICYIRRNEYLKNGNDHKIDISTHWIYVNVWCCIFFENQLPIFTWSDFIIGIRKTSSE